MTVDVVLAYTCQDMSRDRHSAGGTVRAVHDIDRGAAGGRAGLSYPRRLRADKFRVNKACYLEYRALRKCGYLRRSDNGCLNDTERNPEPCVSVCFRDVSAAPGAAACALRRRKAARCLCTHAARCIFME